MSKMEYMPVDCLQVPKVLFQMEKYKNLSNTAKILYSLFLDRLKFAVQNGWVDHNGNLFVIYPKSEIKKDLNTTRYGVDQAVQELVQVGKLVRIIPNNGKANHFYINGIYENEMEEESMMTLDTIMANMPLAEREIIMDKMVKASRDIFETIADMGYIDQYETSLTAMEKRGCAIHVLYDGIDILGCALGGLSTWKLGNVAESYTTSMAGGGNRVISGIIGMVPVTFIVNTNVDRNDIDHPLHLYHRIELTFSTGRLCLVNTHGPVIWLPFLHMPRDEYGTLSINVEEEVNIPSGVTIGNVMLPSVKETFEQIWPDAVKKALEILFKQNRTEKMSMAQYQIYVSKLWSEICQKVGYMNIVDYDNFGDIKNIFYDLEKRHLIKKENDGIE